MTQRQWLEKIRRHAPELSEEEMRILWNEVSDRYCEETKILEGQWSFTTEPGQMYYDLDPECIGIFEVNYAGELCDKITNVRNIPIGR